MKVEQLEIFKPGFNHRTRGRILTDIIWKELNVHEKINIRNHCSCEFLNYPNYAYLDYHFRYGTWKSPFAEWVWKQNSMKKPQPRNLINK